MKTHIDTTLRLLHVEIYNAIREAWTEHMLSPSLVELRAATHYSLTSISKAIKDLKRKGYIKAVPYQARSTRPTDPERWLANEKPKPWDELKPPKQYFYLTERKTHR